ncbi:MAG: ABC transporter ATP-binding protein [Phycisphaeraceae bacterium]
MTAGEPAQPDAATPAIDVRGLSHAYKPMRQRRPSRKHAPPPQDAALDRIDLRVEPGEVFALLGPNGSGKSTLLRILATVQAARQTGDAPGSASVFGHDVARDACQVRQQLGVVFQHPALDLKLTAFENLRTHGRLFGLAGQALDDAARQALGALGLADRIHDDTESFSGGMRRRVEIAKALLTKPRLLLMDEASAGLDLAIQRDIWSDLRQRVADTGLTVLLTTHLMHEAEQADRVAVMSNGKVLAIDTPHALVGKVGGQVLEITPATGTTPDTLLKDIRAQLPDGLAVTDPLVQQGKVHIEHADAAAMIQPLASALGERAAGFRLGRPTLADAYLKLTGQTLSE